MAGADARLRVHRVPHSTNVERVALAAAHKGLAIDWVDHADGDRSAVLALSGQPLVPVLEAGDEVTVDSVAILRRLEQIAPAPPLWPDRPSERALTDIAIGWFDGVWKLAPNAIAAERASDAPNRSSLAQLSAAMRDSLPWFEALLDGRDFLLGERLGALDVVAFPFLRYGVIAPGPDDKDPFHGVLHEHLPIASQRPRLAAWVARIDALPRA